MALSDAKFLAHIQDYIEEEEEQEKREVRLVYVLGINQNPIQLHVVAALEGGWLQWGEAAGAAVF